MRQPSLKHIPVTKHSTKAATGKLTLKFKDTFGIDIGHKGRCCVVTSFLPLHPLLHVTIPKSMKALSLRDHVVWMEVPHAVLDGRSCQGWRAARGHFHAAFLSLPQHRLFYSVWWLWEWREEVSTRIGLSNLTGPVLHVPGSQTECWKSLTWTIIPVQLGVPLDHADLPVLFEPNHCKFILKYDFKPYFA